VITPLLKSLRGGAALPAGGITHGGRAQPHQQPFSILIQLQEHIKRGAGEDESQAFLVKPGEPVGQQANPQAVGEVVKKQVPLHDPEIRAVIGVALHKIVKRPKSKKMLVFVMAEGLHPGKMRHLDVNPATGPGNAVQLLQGAHGVGQVFQDMGANHQVKGVVLQGPGPRRQVGGNIHLTFPGQVRAKAPVEANGPRALAGPAAHVQDAFADKLLQELGLCPLTMGKQPHKFSGLPPVPLGPP
jgi:hypothetical protein